MGNMGYSSRLVTAAVSITGTLLLTMLATGRGTTGGNAKKTSVQPSNSTRTVSPASEGTWATQRSARRQLRLATAAMASARCPQLFLLLLHVPRAPLPHVLSGLRRRRRIWPPPPLTPVPLRPPGRQRQDPKLLTNSTEENNR